MECANDASLPSYLGYFFVALSISDWDTLMWVLILMLIFTIGNEENMKYLLWGIEQRYYTLR